MAISTIRSCRSLCLFQAIVALSGCAYFTQGVPDADRGALGDTAPDLFGDHADKVVYLDQGWDAADSLWFYTTTQGSDLVPYDVFLNLEQADRQVPFRDTENIRKYRYLTQKPTWGNPDALPVGWVKDSFQGNDYLGLTCAACHTTQINHNGTGIRIDGGPALADAESMLTGLEAALDAALANSETFDRLARAVLKGDAADPDKRDGLRSQVTTARAALAAENVSNKSSHGRYG
jgi:hypothetical protein